MPAGRRSLCSPMFPSSPFGIEVPWQIDCRRVSLSVIISSMPETSIQTPPGFNELPKAEQVRYLQALWDQISTNPDEVPVPEEHLRLAEERLRRYREDPSTAKTAFDVVDRLA